MVIPFICMFYSEPMVHVFPLSPALFCTITRENNVHREHDVARPCAVGIMVKI